MKQSLNVLAINTSAKKDGSVSRTLIADLLRALEDRHGDIDIVERDLADGLPFINAAWVEANFTADGDRTDRHRQTLAESDALVAELEAADVLVIGAPIYNFSIPAVLKAWIDMVTRARLTFRYTESGPEGLLKGKKAFVVVPSGGVHVGSPVDFSTPYLKQALGFVGITDVEFIGARAADSGNREALDTARSRIAELVHLAPHAA